ncbi:hypothetical protein FACS189418_4230 [Clostridia bacterium]|nr:hypothetical protein FACS189418_4230 [Clostridia bacterium]
MEKTVAVESGKHRKTYFSYFLYSIFFVMLWSIVYFVFRLQNTRLLYNGDGVAQHYPILLYFRDYLKNIIQKISSGDFNLPLFDFHIGLGEDILRFSSHSAPLDLVSICAVFVPSEYMIYFYDGIIVLRMFLAGIAFLHFSHFKGIKESYALFGALNYVFSGWVIYTCVKHPFFLIGLFYLPLLTESLEKILNKNSPYPFIFFLALSAMTGFYFLYMELLFLGFYFLLRVRFSFSEFFRFCRFVVLGLSLAGVYLIPIILGYLDSSRSSTHQSLSLVYSLDEYVKMFIGLVSGVVTDWNMLMLSGFSVLSVVYFLIRRSKKKDPEGIFLKNLFVGLIVLFVLPIGGFIFNGFSYASHRWSFILIFVFNLIFVHTLPDLLEQEDGPYGVLGLILFFFCVGFLFAENDLKIDRTFLFFDALMLLLSYFVLCLTQNKISFVSKVNVKYSLKFFKNIPLRQFLCFICLLLNLIGNVVLHFDQEMQEADTRETKLETQALFYQDTVSDSDFFRVDFRREKQWENYAIIEKSYYGLGEYWSMINGNITNWLKELNNNDITTNNRYMNLDHSTILNAITSVKAMIIWEDTAEEYLPFAYRKNDGQEMIKKGYWYENPYALPLGFTYEKAISFSDYQGLSALQKQEMLLEALAVSDGQENISSENLKFSQGELAYTLSYQGLVWDKEKQQLIVTENGGSMSLDFEGKIGSELYLQLEGLIYHNQKEPYTYVKYKKGTLEKSSQVLSENGNWYWDRKDYLVNLQYQKEKAGQIKIYFQEGMYSLQNIRLFDLPMENYETKIKDLQENTLKNLFIGNNIITGQIELLKEEYLFFSIPYSKGWTAKVNGMSAKLLQSNTAFMSLKLPAGKYFIELQYKTPGLTAGIFCSLASIFFILREMLESRRLRK